MARQKGWWGQSVAAVAVLALAGCSTAEDIEVQPKASDAKPSASSSAGTSGGGAGTGTLPGVPTAEQARAELAELKVAPHGSMSGYSREKFSHWAEQGEHCNTRETVLERDGTDVTRDDECRAVSGRWVSVYDERLAVRGEHMDAGGAEGVRERPDAPAAAGRLRCFQPQQGRPGTGRVEAAVPGVLVHLCPGMGVGEVRLRAVDDRGREGRAHRHAGYLPLMNAHPPQPEQLVSEVKAGQGGAMTDEVGIITGDLTVATRLLPDGRADIAIQYTDAEDWYVLTGSPAPVPPEGLAALHEQVLERVRHGGGAEAPR